MKVLEVLEEWKFAKKGKFPNFEKEKKDFKRKDGRDSQSSQGIMCFECNEHGHLKKECPNYLRAKGKMYATTLSDLDSSNLDSNESCDGEGNFSTFMTIALMESLDDLGVLVEELGENTELESIGIIEESNDEEEEGTKGLLETYSYLIKKTGEYAKVANVAIKKMKRAEEDYRGLLVRYKETKCEMETLNGELTEAYSKIKFLELEVVQVNAKVEQVSSKKLDDVLARQKPFTDRSRLGYTGESSLAANTSKEMKFVKAKELMVITTTTEIVKVEKKRNVTDQRFTTKPLNQSVVKPKGKGKSLTKSQRGPRTQHFCHHCGIQRYTRPNCHKLKVLKNSSDQRSREPKHGKGNWIAEQSKGQEGDPRVRDVMRMIDAFTICLASFTRRFESHSDRTQSYKDITLNAIVV